MQKAIAIHRVYLVLNIDNTMVGAPFNNALYGIIYRLPDVNKL